MATPETPFWQNNQTVVGIDEVGRGPMAGPLVVCGVVLPIGYTNPEIRDSKILSVKKRNLLSKIIYAEALEIQVVIVDVASIDRLNIYQATRRAMTSIACASSADVVLTDAMKLPDVQHKPVYDLVHGDRLSVSIAAASIVAKVLRDDYMIRMDRLYPGYGFASHKGYGTLAHKEAMIRLGRTPLHRKSFQFHQ